MMKIHLLSESTINKIATGEVIDRPLSAVKELVENAIDAGATEISVVIERGGRTLISVSDNGCGIDKESLKLAVTRYATSKLLDEDISNIQYMGFRGEALAAIATAGRVRISSRTYDSPDAWLIETVSEGFDIRPTAHVQGTTVEVRDLFCFIPNRVRFLKPESSEAVACKNLIEAFALAHQNIKFRLLHNQKEIFSCSDNILNEVLGEDFLRNAIKFDTGDYYRDISRIRLNGYVSIPTYNRTSNNRIFTFVNKRFIKDNFLNKLIRQAYFNTLPDGINPSIVLFIELPPQCIDVNIHPNKSEVRFSDEKLIRDIVINSIRDTIRNARTKLINYQEKKIDNKIDVTHKNLAFELKDIEPIERSKITYMIDDKVTNTTKSSVYLGKAILQIANKYVVAVKEGSLILVDQHAAHERIVLEQINTMDFKVQDFLFPIEYDFGKAENEMLLSISENLFEIGIRITFVDRIIIHSAPLIPGHLDVIAFMKDIVENELLWKEILRSHIDEMLKKIACYSSIRAGKKLNLEEMQNLLLLIEKTDFGSQCIHGRPTYLEFDIATIDKLFERS